MHFSLFVLGFFLPSELLRLYLFCLSFEKKKFLLEEKSEQNLCGELFPIKHHANVWWQLCFVGPMVIYCLPWLTTNAAMQNSMSS